MLCLVSLVSVRAQLFKTGVLVGMSASQVEGDGYGGYKKVGAMLGGYSSLNLSEDWSIQFEIMYIGKGSRKIARPDKGDYDAFKLNLNYVEVPVAIKRKINVFDVEAGPYYGRLFGYRMEDVFGQIPVLNFPFKASDWGVFFGVQYQVNDQIAINVRSKNSVIPIRNFDNFDQNIGLLNKLFNRGWYNLDLNFSVRYQFNH